MSKRVGLGSISSQKQAITTTKTNKEIKKKDTGHSRRTRTTIIFCSLLFLLFFLQTVCPHYGVLTVVVRSGVLRGVLPPLRFSTAQARTEFRLRRQCRTEWLPRDFGLFYRVSVHVLRQNVVLRDRCRRSDGFGGPKREFTWQVRGIEHSVKIVAGALFGGRCQDVGRRMSFEGLRFTRQAQGIRTMDAMF